MTIKRRATGGAIAFLLAGVAQPTLAQDNAQTTTPPQTLPGLDTFSLPSSRPTPQATSTPVPIPVPVTPTLPAPIASPTPRATPTLAPSKPAPTTTPTLTPVPPSLATPAPSPTATATATPDATATMAEVPAAEAPVATPTPAAEAAPAEDDNGWWIGGGVVLAGAAAAAWALLRRRRAPIDAPSDDAVREAPPPPPAPAMLARAPERARLSLSLEPRRAGLNLITATVEAELLIENHGTVPAQGIRIGATLIEAGAGQEGAVAAQVAQPIVRPATPPFTLAPGEARRVRIVAAMGRGEIKGVPAGGRAMFVPVVAVNALYQAGEGAEGQSARAFAVGIERVDSAKLGPFWLDAPARMHDALGVRPYAAAIER